MKDFRGTPIWVGDTVVYPTRHGAHVEMHEGVVVEIRHGQGDPNYCSTYMPLLGDKPPAVPYVAPQLTVKAKGRTRLSKLERIDRVTVIAA